jgi:hypothetical protein
VGIPACAWRGPLAQLRNGIEVPRPFQDWGDAISHLFVEVRDRPRTVVIDEFPFLVRSAPSLPSIIQRESGPGGSGGASQIRLILCGSAVSVMGRLRSRMSRGEAPQPARAAASMPTPYYIRPLIPTRLCRSTSRGDGGGYQSSRFSDRMAAV